jgi:hypothetical protein
MCTHWRGTFVCVGMIGISKSVGWRLQSSHDSLRRYNMTGGCFTGTAGSSTQSVCVAIIIQRLQPSRAKKTSGASDRNASASRQAETLYVDKQAEVDRVQLVLGILPNGTEVKQQNVPAVKGQVPRRSAPVVLQRLIDDDDVVAPQLERSSVESTRHRFEAAERFGVRAEDHLHEIRCAWGHDGLRDVQRTQLGTHRAARHQEVRHDVVLAADQPLLKQR